MQKKYSYFAVFAALFLYCHLQAGPAAAQELEPVYPLPPGPYQFLDDAALRELAHDRTHYSEYSEGKPIIEYQRPDGVTLLWEDDCLHLGEWWVQYGYLCYNYQNDAIGGPHCFKVTEYQSNYYFLYEGGDSLQHNNRTYKVVPGNAENLDPETSPACSRLGV